MKLLCGFIQQKPVIVFNSRPETTVAESGVIYKKSEDLWDYFCKFEPEVHIAWRHNVKMTDAPTYLWCHDLVTPGAETYTNYEKIICLSDFHKNYVQVQQQIPDDKIVISRNGINQERFKQNAIKNPLKIVWPSSPDRGLDRVIDIVEIARNKTGHDFELHVYYGFDNMKKYGGGFAQMAIHLEEKIKTRPWVKYHGNLEQKLLAKELLEASMWIYPANFIETYCITVLESICAGVYPIVREIGALKNTVRPFVEKGMADLLFLDASTDEEKEQWADKVIDCYNQKKWEKVSMQDDYSWKGVAEHFCEFMKIAREPEETIDLTKLETFTPNGSMEANYGLMDIGV